MELELSDIIHGSQLTSEKKNNNFALTIGIISGVIILIVAAFLRFICYKKKSSTSSLSLNVDLSFKKLLNKN